MLPGKRDSTHPSYNFMERDGFEMKSLAQRVCWIILGGILFGRLAAGPVFARPVGLAGPGVEPQAVIPTPTATPVPTPQNPVYLPNIANYYPPIPFAPSLSPVNSPDGGMYTLAWSEKPVRLADTYLLQEAGDPNFILNVRNACVTTTSSCELVGMRAGNYYYRVMGLNNWGTSSWSNTQSAQVLLPDTPVLYPVTQQAGDGSFTLSWSAAARADYYWLQESSDATFARPKTVQVSGTSFRVTEQQLGNHYFQVQASGPTGDSPWSAPLAVAVQPPDIPSLDRISPTGIDGFFTVSWSTAARASYYVLEESHDNSFRSATTVYTGPALSWRALNKTFGAYYYRVKAVNLLGESDWSGPRSTAVVQPAPGVWILGNSMTYVSDGMRNVVGEVLNNTDGILDLMRVEVSFYDASGHQIATDYSYTYLNKIMPHEKACFHMAVIDPPGWSTYRFSGSYTPGSIPRPNLGVNNTSGSINFDGAYQIVGSVSNSNAFDVRLVNPVATLYNPDGFVVGCGYSYVNSLHLAAYQASNFSLTIATPDAYGVVLYVIAVDVRR